MVDVGKCYAHLVYESSNALAGIYVVVQQRYEGLNIEMRP